MVGINFRYTANPKDVVMLVQQGGGCFYCGGGLSLKTTTHDHLFPRDAGRGRDKRLNKVLACADCNSRKGNRQPTPVEVERARNLYRNCGLPAFAVPA